MRKVLSVLLVLVSASVSFGQYGVSRSGRNGNSSRSRSAASARPPTPYDYIARGYTMAWMDKQLGAGYSTRATISVDANYKASGSYSESTGFSDSIIVINPFYKRSK